MKYRNLTMKDFAGVQLPPPPTSGLDLLAIIARRALEIYAGEEGSAPKRSNKKRKAAAAEESPEKRVRFVGGRRLENGPSPPPPLPEVFRTVINCFSGETETRKVSFILQKRLCKTDLSGGHNRLSLPMNQIQTPDFLRDYEVENLKLREGKNMKKEEVHIVEPNLNKTTANLVRWDMGKDNGKVSTSYAIITTWGSIHRRNQLKIGMVLQIWSFRVGERLGFALVVVPED